MSNRMRLHAQNIVSLKQSRVDRQHKVIYDVVAMQIGPGLDSRDLGVDRKTLHQMMELGNKKSRGVLGRFGHPSASDNAMGYQVMRAKNFRVVDNKLLHDAHLILHAQDSPVFDRDPLDYLMNMAEDNPQDLGESVVITTDLMWVLENGSELAYWEDQGNAIPTPQPQNSLFDYPILRPQKFHNVDFVMEGNLTPEGLYSQFATAMFADSVHSDLMTLFNNVDDVRQRYNIPIEVLPDKLVHVGNSYLHHLGLGENFTMTAEQTPQVALDQDTSIPPAVDITPTDSTLADFQDQIHALSARIDQSAITEDDNSVTLSQEEYSRLLGLETQLVTIQQQMQQLFQLMSGLQGNYESLHTNQQSLNQKVLVLNNEQAQVVPVPTSAQQVAMSSHSIPPALLTQQPSYFDQRLAQDHAQLGDQSAHLTQADNPMGRLMNNVGRRNQAKH
jgi:hypothetical protein